MNTCAAAVKLPIRAAPVFGATTNVTVPLPLPDVALVSVIHDSLEAAVHAHPLAVVRFVEPVPPLAPTSELDGYIE